ncbi:MAG TPA: 3-carboxy-cis,cis-muconate cycloisomerase [Stellaceae bacterium]|nr:3-carboxy-cis,cis-muconate cycloisomerase [Stellaceae bacterium]
MPVNPADSPIFGALYGTEEMRDAFSDSALMRRMLEVEAALARVEAELGIIPADAAAAIVRAAKPEHLDAAALRENARLVGYPVLGVARALGRAAGTEAEKYVHWGATTQDIADTALVLQIRDGFQLVERDLRRLVAALAQQAATHRDTVMPGRTFLQQALPITFGYKCAVWLAPLLDHLDRLQELRPRVLKVQFAGAVGTLASLGKNGRAVTLGLARALDLAAPEAPWHVARDSVAETAALLSLICGSLAKIAGDIILLSQTEVGEVAEPAEAGRGGSSTLPQKRNPIASTYIVAASRGVQALLPIMFGALAQDHERATGAWQSEQLALPQMFVLAAGALTQGVALAQGLTVDRERMRGNLDATGGLVMSEAVMMALAEKIGRAEAHRIVQDAARNALATKRPLAAALKEDAVVRRHLDDAALTRLLDPAHYVGEAKDVVDRVLARAAKY